jgi:phospholipid transport system substrate-binding protein
MINKFSSRVRFGLIAAAILIVSASSSVVMAEDATPDVLVKNVTNEVLDIVRKDKDIQSGNTKKAIDLVEAKVLPNFDFGRMTTLAVGRDWKSANATQQKTLTDEFHTLLVRTYSNALTAYKSQTIDFKPLKMAAGDTDVTVRTEVKQAGAKPISIDYSLEKTDNTWKVYDVVVGGVSLVTSYRDQFKQEINTGGIEGLIKSLQAKNQASAVAVKK